MQTVIEEFRQNLKAQVQIWNDQALQMDLGKLQKQIALEKGVPEYSLDTPVVYNRDLDKITSDDEIKLIVIGDNPGKDEQLLKNNRYLVGQAGKIGEGFFKRNPELGIDFRKNVIILNKTPVHSAKTAHLKQIAKQGGKEAADLILESQLWMAKKTAELLHKLPNTQLWLIGYSELNNKGIFTPYRDELKKSILEYSQEDWQRVFVYQHFSMNRFTINLAEYIEENNLQNIPLSQQLYNIGEFHKKEIFL